MTRQTAETLWFTTMDGLLGVVLTKDNLGIKRVYIGQASGHDSEGDVKHILEWGTTVPLPMAERIVNWLKSKPVMPKPGPPEIIQKTFPEKKGGIKC